MENESKKTNADEQELLNTDAGNLTDKVTQVVDYGTLDEQPEDKESK